MQKKAVVLLSGGLDSTTALALAKKDGFEIYALTFNYGQKHAIEVNCARKIAETIGVTYRTLYLVGNCRFTAEMAERLEAIGFDMPYEEFSVKFRPTAEDLEAAAAWGGRA